MSDEYTNDNINITEPDPIPTDSSEKSADDSSVNISDTVINTRAAESKETADQDAAYNTAASTADTGKTKDNITNSESTENPAPAQSQPDPYNKYNFYNGNQYYQGYQSQGYQQAPQGIYATSAPQYTGAYGQNTAYGQAAGAYGQNTNSYGQNANTYGQNTNTYGQNAYQNPPYGNQQYNNPYPAGQISYVSSVDSIYPGTAPHRTGAKKEKSAAGKFFMGLAMSVAFGLVAAGVFILITYFYKQQNPDLFNNTSAPVQITTSSSKNDNQLNLDPAEGTKVPSTTVIDASTFSGTDVSKVVEENMPAIVAIDCITQSYNYWYGTIESPSAGSGIIIQKNEKELMIATNNHVVSDTKDIKVKFIDGTTAPAKIKGNDEVADLAVLSINLSDISEATLNVITIAKLGNSDEIKVGEMAIAIGNALGYGQSVTVGYLSAKDREITIDGQKYSGLLQTDAAINPGNSGGALLNLKGEVIGINNAKITGSDVEGMGYAIPISKAQDIITEYVNREVLTSEEQGYMGISISNVSNEMASIYNWPIGAYIAKIEADSAAEKSGLQVGDIITKIDNLEIKTSDTLIEKVKSLRCGTEISVTFQRRVDGEFQEMTVQLVLGQRPVTNDSIPE